ncbi:unnamed protein product [Sphagnum jensenii]|uniref:Uncharacterized protein n=1 Tax=Sphagnum jensenii TaxID=128206 RepID=A0ABP0VCF7_9BRYO
MHFYPGVARYEEPGKEPLTVLLNENTIRKMSPTFCGAPLFVDHVEGIDENNVEINKDASDGWVIRSFYNEADGKTWCEFMVHTKRGLEAIKRGYRLSNAYVPTQYGEGGMWNGVDYDKTVLDGNFEHLAIVMNPRYEESVIMTPEEFKAYNEKQTVELKRLTNSNDKKETKMKLNIFKRTKVENSLDLDGMMVELPKSKKEMSLTKVVEAYDTILNMNGYANGDHMVKVGEEEHSVNDLVKKHMNLVKEMEGMKAKNADGEDDKDAKVKDEELDDEILSDDDVQNDDDESVDNDSSEDIESFGEKSVDGRGGDQHLGNLKKTSSTRKRKFGMLRKLPEPKLSA